MHRFVVVPDSQLHVGSTRTDVFGVREPSQYGRHGHVHGQLPVPYTVDACSLRVHRPEVGDVTGPGNIIVYCGFGTRILPRTSRRRKYQNSANIAVNIKTLRIFPPFLAQNLERCKVNECYKLVSFKVPQISQGAASVPFYSYVCPTFSL